MNIIVDCAVENCLEFQIKYYTSMKSKMNGGALRYLWMTQ